MYKWFFNPKTIVVAFVIVNLQVGNMQISIDKTNNSAPVVIDNQQGVDGKKMTVQVSGSTVKGEESKQQGQTVVVNSPIPTQAFPTSTPFSMASPVPSDTIDTLDYFISNHLDKGLDGEHTQNYTDFSNGHPMGQHVSGNSSYYVKWASGVFETHTWDDKYIYLSEDHSGAPVNIYTFNPGIWMKRQMKIGEKITGANNTIQWYNNLCQKGLSMQFPIELVLEKHDPAYEVGGDLGKQDVIVLKYITGGLYERFYYSKEWGWVRWEEYDKLTGILRNRRTFNKIITPIKPALELSCRK